MMALWGILIAAIAVLIGTAQKAEGIPTSGPRLKDQPPPPLPEPKPTPAKLIGGTTVSISKSNFRQILEPIAEQITTEYGIQPRIALAQWAHETGYGAGEIFKASYNLGSITAGSWAIFGQDKVWHALPGREIIVRRTEEYVTKTEPADQILSDYAAQTEAGVPLMKVLRQVPFRKYPDLLSAARDWAELISKSSRYKAAYAAAREGDVDAYGRELQSAGYATDPKYAAKLSGLASVLYA